MQVVGGTGKHSEDGKGCLTELMKALFNSLHMKNAYEPGLIHGINRGRRQAVVRHRKGCRYERPGDICLCMDGLQVRQLMCTLQGISLIMGAGCRVGKASYILATCMHLNTCMRACSRQAGPHSFCRAWQSADCCLPACTQHKARPLKYTRMQILQILHTPVLVCLWHTAAPCRVAAAQALLVSENACMGFAGTAHEARHGLLFARAHLQLSCRHASQSRGAARLEGCVVYCIDVLRAAPSITRRNSLNWRGL